MLRELIIQYGLALVFANVLLESLGLPLPALPTLIVTGALAAAGFQEPAGIGAGLGVLWAGLPTFAAIFASAVFAALLGDAAWYFAGRRFGGRILRKLCQLSLSRDTCVRRTERFFERWGVRVLAVSKFIPGLSTLALPMAGAAGVPLRVFLFYDTIGAVLWAGVGVGLGIVFASAVDTLLLALDLFGQGALGLVAVLLAIYLGVRWWHRYTLLRRLRLARIRVEDLYRLMQGEAAPFLVDVRSARHRRLDPYAIPGAQVIDSIELAALDQRLAQVPRHRKVVVYCSCPNEVSAALLASKLVKHGFIDVAPLLGGLDAWRAAGFAVAALGLDGLPEAAEILANKLAGPVRESGQAGIRPASQPASQPTPQPTSHPASHSASHPASDPAS